MGAVISLHERKERLVAEEHARALVLFECAAHLARTAHPGLVDLINEAFGPEFIEERVRNATTPRLMTDAPQMPRAKSRRAR